MVDGAAGRRGLGADLDPPCPRDVLLHGVGDEVTIGSIVEHLAMERARYERDGEHTAFEAHGNAVLDDGTQQRLLLEDLLGCEGPSRAEIDGLRALDGGTRGSGRTLDGGWRARGRTWSRCGRDRTRRRRGSVEEARLRRGGARSRGRAAQPIRRLVDLGD